MATAGANVNSTAWERQPYRDHVRGFAAGQFVQGNLQKLIVVEAKCLRAPGVQPRSIAIEVWRIHWFSYPMCSESEGVDPPKMQPGLRMTERDT